MKMNTRYQGGAAGRGFTLIEILIVLVIISILMALMFPAFKRAQEGAAQASCATNLKEIFMAVSQYKDDEKAYPASLAVLLPQTEGSAAQTLRRLNMGTGPAYINGANNITPALSPSEQAKYLCGADTCPNPRGAGYLKATSSLLCPDDDKEDQLRSSYGDVSTSLTTPYPDAAGNEGYYLSRAMWNFWGYNDQGRAYNDSAAAAAANTGSGTPTTYPLLVDINRGYSVRDNRVRNSLSNRFAPANTIITHCVFHRTQTAEDITTPDQLYSTTTPPVSPRGARDLILRLDGSAKPYDVTEFNTPAPGESQARWQTQSFR